MGTPHEKIEVEICDSLSEACVTMRDIERIRTIGNHLSYVIGQLRTMELNAEGLTKKNYINKLRGQLEEASTIAWSYFE